MKVTLRKAAAIQGIILETIKATTPNVRTEINLFTDPVPTLDRAAEKFANDVDKVDALYRAFYAVRENVAHVGNGVGISALLAEQALLEKLTQVYKPLAATFEFAMTEEELVAKHTRLLAEREKAESYSRQESFTAYVAERSTIAEFAEKVTEYRRRKQEISDELLTANVANFIVLDPTTVTTLKEYAIV